jgi:hypothetical protein
LHIEKSKTAGAKRVHECKMDKISNGLNMLKRAIKHGFRAKYVLVDSWFSSKELILTTQHLAQESMHVICAKIKEIMFTKRRF